MGYPVLPQRLTLEHIIEVVGMAVIGLNFFLNWVLD